MSLNQSTAGHPQTPGYSNFTDQTRAISSIEVYTTGTWGQDVVVNNNLPSVPCPANGDNGNQIKMFPKSP